MERVGVRGAGEGRKSGLLEEVQAIINVMLDKMILEFHPWDFLSCEVNLNGICPTKALMVVRILLGVEFLNLL